MAELWENDDASNNHDKSIAAHAVKEGLRNVLDSLGYEGSPDDEKSWIYQIDINRKLNQVGTYLCFSEGLKGVDGQMNIRPGERFLVGISRRFTAEDLIHLRSLAFFQVHAAWHDNSNACQILVPVQEALHCCWKDTDKIFEPLSNWMRKPIEFRHPYCFYYVHIMAFANLKLFDGEPPSSFDIMFSRGMDPIVVDPSKCHAHPGAPQQWPDIDTLKAYVQRTRAKIMDAVQSGLLGMGALTFALEHERMHQETLMYMVVQQKKADFEREPCTHYQESDSQLLDLKNLTLSSGTPDIFVSPGKVCLGANFRETVFLWDNEYPILDTVVEKPILVSSKPVTVKEFLKFILVGGYDKEDLWQPADFAFFRQQRLNCPATWSLEAGDYYVHYAEKTIHWSKVAEQPAFVSLSEAEAFCSWVGCRVMTESEYQRILDCNNDGRVKQLRTGGWEWTSTIFAPFPGFEPMPMYSEYSADFFDGSHYVLKGSSPATHPSMHRDTFRNFYQRQYPYVFAKFRCCKSVG
ncbi:hypothetical protein O6H91_Y041700 [Diphasiastrum complanatum]|nr:hypothetical protein O6H91_Y041700 [Diphasiastrum complanatum]